MPRPLRDKDPSRFRLITIRTQEARIWMVPTRKLEKLVGGIVARYQELLSIEIFALNFLGNHYHLLIRAPLSNTDEFEENINREIARRINWKYQREGNFWHRRYDDQKVLCEEDLREAFLYVLTNPVHHGLVKHPQEWPGLSSYRQSFSESDRTFSFHHYSAGEGEPRVTRHRLRISTLPELQGLTKRERVAKIHQLIEERTQLLVQLRRAEGKGFLGIAKILSQVPGERPESVNRSKRPPCYTKNGALRREYRELARIRARSYAEASFKYRLGAHEVEFPPYSYKPPLHRLPRLVPFKPLSPEYLVTMG